MTTATRPHLQSFFELLYPEVGDGYLVLSRPHPTRRTRQGKPALVSTWCNLAQTSWAHIAEKAAPVIEASNLYFGVVLQQPTATPGPWRRGTNATAYIVPGLWCDLDLAYGQHAASTLPATDAEALDFLSSLPAPPSLLVHSGGGLYGYWLFREPYRITTEAEHTRISHLSAQFAYTLVEAGTHRGWTLDAVGDLARVLRPPGTINHKYGKVVEVLHAADARDNPSDFDAWLLDLPEPVRTTHAGAGIPGQPDVVTVAEHYGTTLEPKSTTELAGAHPQHGSSTGDNFNVNTAKGLWRCWRHGTGGDALALIAVCEGLIPCEAMRRGALRGETFTRVIDLANTHFQAGITLDAFQRRNGPTPPAAPEVQAATGPLPYSDYTNALAFVREHGQYLRYCYPWKSWLVWSGTHWQRDTSGAVMQMAKTTIKRLAQQLDHLDDKAAKLLLAHIKTSLSTAKLKALVESAQDEPGIPVQPEAFDTDIWLLNCANGTLDLRTGTLRPHRQADLLTKCLPIPYEHDATCPTWDAFLWRIMGGSQGADDPDMSVSALEARQQADDRARDLIAYLQRCAGYTLSGSTREQCLFLCHGPTKTGKTTYLAILRKMLGLYAKQADMETFMHKDRPEVRNDLADLAGARYVYAVESQEGKRLAEGLMKQMTGGADHLKARFLFQEYFEFPPQFKAYIGTNHLPVIKDSDDSIWERVRKIPFTVQIPKADRDKDLEATLTTELPGILAWAVEGCLAWQEKHDLAEPEAVVRATQDYRAEMDSVARFLAECCRFHEQFRIKTGDLFAAFVTWSEGTGVKPLTLVEFGKRLDGKKIEKKTSNFVWRLGLTLKDT
jgi:P4 family phage/plasmid primase-like protien